MQQRASLPPARRSLNVQTGAVEGAGTVTVFAEQGSGRTFAQLAGVAVVAELHRQLDDAPDADGDEAHAADARHDLLQVGHIVRALQRAGAAAHYSAFRLLANTGGCQTIASAEFSLQSHLLESIPREHAQHGLLLAFFHSWQWRACLQPRGDAHRQQRGGAAEECLLPGGVHQRVLLALLDGGARECDVAGKLLRGQRLARQSGLVDLLRSRGQDRRSDRIPLC